MAFIISLIYVIFFYALIINFVAMKNSMDNILILTDFSASSWNSIIYSLALFHKKDICNFFVMATTEFKDNEVGKENIKDPLFGPRSKTNIEEELLSFIEKAKAYSKNNQHSFAPIFSGKNILEDTRNEVKEKEIDLIVIGSDGVNLAENTKYKSLPEEIITKVKCPTLVIPSNSIFCGLNEIVFPTNFTNFNEAKLLQKSRNLFSSRNSVTHILYLAKNDSVLDKEQVLNKETLEHFFTGQLSRFHFDINKNLEQSIENFINKMNIDMLIIAAKNLNLLEQILFRPQITNMSYFSQTPFLLLH